MKKIVAIIKPFKFGEVDDALREAGVRSLTVTEVKGLGRQLGHTELYMGQPYAADFLSKVMIEVVLDDDQLDSTVEVIGIAAKTGRIGDGKIFVTSIDEAFCIRTGKKGLDAI